MARDGLPSPTVVNLPHGVRQAQSVPGVGHRHVVLRSPRLHGLTGHAVPKLKLTNKKRKLAYEAEFEAAKAQFGQVLQEQLEAISAVYGQYLIETVEELPVESKRESFVQAN